MIDDSLFTGSFYSHANECVSGPEIGMTMKKAGSMRFRWNETNPNRQAFLSSLAGEDKQIAAVELIHSQTVFAIDSADEVFECQGDGIITTNKNIIPVITVADCMPIFIYEPHTEVFGILHSGWKGTGIVRNAIELAQKKYGSKPENFCVVMGPHIHDCCYNVDEERAQYFRVNFTPDCVKEILPSTPGYNPTNPYRYRLSLAKANLSILREMGINEGSLCVYNDCTCCDSKFGSFRRETMTLPPDTDLETRQRSFTVQAAWVRFN